MSGHGSALQGVVGLVAQKKYHLLTWENIQNAKTDLNYLLKGIVGAEADNVGHLQSFCTSFFKKNKCYYIMISKFEPSTHKKWLISFTDYML
jgi:hypothetical protein